MDLLACTLLRRETQSYQLKYAFAQLKNHHPTKATNLSFRDQQAFGSVQGSVPSIQLNNRELYLNYMEQVLRNKQKQLAQLQHSLMSDKKKQWEQQAGRTLATPLELTHKAEVLNKTCELFQEMLSKFVSKYPQMSMDPSFREFSNNLKYIQQTFSDNYCELKDQLITNHQELVLQREQLGQKLSKLQELQSYEKYLTQLQKVLEEKQFNIIQKECQSSKTLQLPSENANITLELGPETPQYNTYQEQEQNNSNDHCSRKRAKIFDSKTKKNSHSVSNQRQSSKIMQERSTQDYHPTLFTDSHPIEEFPEQEKQTNDNGTQTFFESQKEQASGFIHKQSVYLKFLKLWIKHSLKKSKGPISHTATMTLYRWRLNALYDQKIKTSAIEILAWPKKLEKLGNIPHLNYSHLTLRKQKYLEQFFDFERRKFQRQKILTSLRSILKNKNRKERTAVFIYFKKYKELAKWANFFKLVPPSHSTSQSQALRQITTQHSQISNFGHSHSRQKESRVNQNSCTFIEDPLKISNAKSKSSKQSALHSSQIKAKGKQNNIDIQKLKQYIKSQEETEARLAIECAQTEAIYRITNILNKKANHLQNNFLICLIRQDENDRVGRLEQAVNGYEFKWELFMAKARLALTTNSNKVSHLQQLLSFIGSDK